MTVPHVGAIRCSFCQKQRRAFRVHQLASGQSICDHCLEWHHAAVAVLGGGVPRGCQACDTTWERLRETPGPEVRMYVVPRDGIYQLLCAACARQYTAKRAELYRGTQFGAEALKV